MDFKQMCIQQGYVPSTCSMDGQMCWLLINNGKDPCEGCYNNRSQCNGRHAPYENELFRSLARYIRRVEQKNRLDEDLLKIRENRIIKQRRILLKSLKSKIYFNREKEDNWDLEKKMEKKGFNTENILYLGSEIEVKVELFEDGSNKILAFQGVDISDKNISI